MSVIIDANLLCLLVVGAADPDAINSHARLKTFGIEDYSNLLAIIDRKGQLVLCPHVLSETSNLIAYRQPPAQLSRFRNSLAMLITAFDEATAPARQAVEATEYVRLGLPDAILLLLGAANNFTLLSDDLQLCLAAERRGLTTINYNYVRDGALRITEL